MAEIEGPPDNGNPNSDFSAAKINSELQSAEWNGYQKQTASAVSESWQCIISQASNFRDLSKIAKLNTRKFFELPITMILSA